MNYFPTKTLLPAMKNPSIILMILSVTYIPHEFVVKFIFFGELFGLIQILFLQVQT